MRKDKEMKRWTQKAVILAVGVVIMLIAGCERENPLAKENMQLKEQIAQCQQGRKDVEERIEEEIKGLSENAIKDWEEILKLREENAKLKSQIEQLEVHVQQLEKEFKKLAAPQPL